MKELIYKGKRIYHFGKTGLRGWWAAWRYRHPEKELTIITITGTDGKTTTSTFVYQLLKQAGYRVGLLSTVAAYIGHEQIDTGFHVTTPHPEDIYRLLRQMVDEGLEYVVLEVTSQGAYQWRNWGITAKIAGLTNVDLEHLDYHLTFDNYLAAKMLVLNQAQIAVVNDDQPYFHQVKKQLKSTVELVTYNKSTRFSAEVEKAIRQRVSEDYNRLNAHLALTIAKKLGLSDKQLLPGIKAFALPTGRMQLLPNKLDCTVIVDFAHTAQGIQAALPAIRKSHLAKDGQLITVVGCAGKRDKGKRPVMGRAAASLSDVAIFTSEDPRGENIYTIIRQMKEDISPYQRRVVSIPDRREAVTFALEKYGHSHNTLVFFGKGHEQSMNYDGQTETAWNDITDGQQIIARLEKERHSA